MKTYDCVQGTSEWLELRAGIPTASQFDMLLTPTGKPSASAVRYMHMLLAERMMGRPMTEHMSFWMERGSEMEAEAVSFYQFQRDVETEVVGFVTNDAGTIGASPDRLVGEDGLLEIKCPAPHTHIGYLLWKTVDKAYYPQVQGQLWITERSWLDILSYHPELPPALIRVERDEQYIKELAAVVTAFSGELERQYAELVANGWIKTRPVREKTTVDLLKESLIAMNNGTI